MKASLGALSGVMIVVTHRVPSPGSGFVATQPAGSAGAVTPSKCSTQGPDGVVLGLGVGLAGGVGVGVPAGVGDGVPPGVGDGVPPGVGDGVPPGVGVGTGAPCPRSYTSTRPIPVPLLSPASSAV